MFNRKLKKEIADLKEKLSEVQKHLDNMPYGLEMVYEIEYCPWAIPRYSSQYIYHKIPIPDLLKQLMDYLDLNIVRKPKVDEVPEKHLLQKKKKNKSVNATNKKTPTKVKKKGK